MPLKFIILTTIVAVASAGYLTPVRMHYAASPAVISKVANPAVADAVASTHQNVVRSFGGTVSQYSKSVHTPYYSVHKEDTTRVNNNVYTPAVAKTVTYTAPAVAKIINYAPAATAATAAAALYTKNSNPILTKTVYASQGPTSAVYASSAPHTIYTQKQPAHTFYTSPTPAATVYTHQKKVPSSVNTAYNHGPVGTTYTHNSPAVSAYGSSQTVHYSPAEMVSHMSFDGFGTHWGF